MAGLHEDREHVGDVDQRQSLPGRGDVSLPGLLRQHPLHRRFQVDIYADNSIQLVHHCHRYHTDMDEALRQYHIDHVYLDTTFADLIFDFPSRVCDVKNHKSAS